MFDKKKYDQTTGDYRGPLDLEGYRHPLPQGLAGDLPIPVIPDIDATILAAVEAPGHELEMGDWHTCKTRHCRAGWAVRLAGAAGYALEKRLGPAVAGALIYQASRGSYPDFYASNNDALADLRRCAAEQTARGMT